MKNPILSIAVLLVSVASLSGQDQLWNLKYRGEYLDKLKKCSTPTPPQECSPVTVINVAILYDKKADVEALSTLLDSARTSEGSMSDTLGWFFSELLCKDPQVFLHAVSVRPEKEHAKLIYLAAVGDSKNLGCLAITSLRSTLRKTASTADSRLAAIAAQTLSALNTYGRGDPNTGDCFVAAFKPKSETELAGMSPRQLMEEGVQNSIHSPQQMHESADYWVLTHNHIRSKAQDVFPIFAEIFDAYDPTLRARCDNKRFFVATVAIENIDNKTVRVRASREGRLAIAALERGIERIKAAKLGDRERETPLALAELHLRMLKGVSIQDEWIRNSLEKAHKIRMSENEFSEFVDFLIGHDPTYPSWSDLADDPPPLVLKYSSKYYAAYLKFRKN